MPAETPAASANPETTGQISLPRNVIWQPWGYEYTCCGGAWGAGHVGHCGA